MLAPFPFSATVQWMHCSVWLLGILSDECFSSDFHHSSARKTCFRTGASIHSFTETMSLCLEIIWRDHSGTVSLYPISWWHPSRKEEKGSCPRWLLLEGNRRPKCHPDLIHREFNCFHGVWVRAITRKLTSLIWSLDYPLRVSSFSCWWWWRSETKSKSNQKGLQGLVAID